MNHKPTFYLIKSVSLMLIFCVWLITAEAQTVNLQLQSDYTVGIAAQTPRYAVGDVNNDGRPDLVTLNKANATANGPISVFLNNGAGGFGAPINITDNTGLSPNAVVISDYNRDGNADLAIAGDGISNGINIRLGNGTGNFPTGTYIAAERGSPAIASADFNGDGNTDVAICNNVNELRVLSGNGAGAFGAAAVFTTANACNDMLAADFNVDGRPDIVTAARVAINSLQVFLNNGAGGFNAPVNNVVNGAYQLVTADFNRDCIPDLAATQFSGIGVVYILIGNGAGSFASTSIAVTNSPAFMTVGDFNRDKKVDLAVRRNAIAPGANNLTILPGNGSGGFGTAFELSVAVPTSTVEMRLATIDANLDGRADIIIGRQGGFLLYHGNSALFTRTENDFDGDLKSDLSVFRPSNGTWYINRSTQGFFAQQWGLGSDKLTPADFDGDGKTDLAVWRENGFGDPNSSYFFILRSSNNTLQQEQFGRAGDVPTVVGDWDGDGRADPAVYRNGAATGAQSFFFYRPSATAGVNFRTVYWGTSGDQAVRGDFDGDGRQDAAVFRPSNAIWYVLQSSNGQSLYQSWGLAADRLVPADYDGDGKTDFAVFRPSNNIWYILNSASGTATYRQWGANADALTPGDYNGDGKTEVSTYRASEQNWHVPQCADNRQTVIKFGASGDVAVPSSLIP
ncbi:MAG: VCBS repeat-containing protein [Acidobacteria bacterium]|nr:VCBS repeat-containing protein [Acidobacteriota bacterium]